MEKKKREKKKGDKGQTQSFQEDGIEEEKS